MEVLEVCCHILVFETWSTYSSFQEHENAIWFLEGEKHALQALKWFHKLGNGRDNSLHCHKFHKSYCPKS